MRTNRHRVFGWSMAAVCLFFLGALTFRASAAADEAAGILEFRRLVQAADPKLAAGRLRNDTNGAPSQADVQEVVDALAIAAVAVMDRGAVFAEAHPRSAHLAEVRGQTITTLSVVFGSKGFPMPKDRVADIERCVRGFLRDGADDFRLHMVLCRVAAELPLPRQRELYEELARDNVPEPARSMAMGALRKFQRLGKPLDLRFTAMDGREVDLAGLRGKVVLIDFWATTCVPCIRELPGLKQLHQRYHDQGLEILGVSLDSDLGVLRRFVEREKVPWPQYFEAAGATNRIARAFEISSIPVVWLVDKHGVLRDMDGRENREEKIRRLLNEE